MKLLADENVFGGIVAWLRSENHDVVWIAETSPSVTDEMVMNLAFEEQRIIISADLDFGELIIKREKKAHGLLLLRMEPLRGSEAEQLFQMRWTEIEDILAGNIAILTPRQLRIRQIN